MVHRALRTRQGDAQGARGETTAEGHHAGTAATAGVLRHGLGYRAQVYLFRYHVLNSCYIHIREYSQSPLQGLLPGGNREYNSHWLLGGDREFIAPILILCLTVAMKGSDLSTNKTELEKYYRRLFPIATW